MLFISFVFHKAIRISLSTFIFDLYFVLTAATDANPASHKCEVTNGIKTCIAVFAICGCSCFTKVQNSMSDDPRFQCRVGLNINELLLFNSDKI